MDASSLKVFPVEIIIFQEHAVAVAEVYVS